MKAEPRDLQSGAYGLRGCDPNTFRFKEHFGMLLPGMVFSSEYDMLIRPALPEGAGVCPSWKPHRAAKNLPHKRVSVTILHVMKHKRRSTSFLSKICSSGSHA